MRAVLGVCPLSFPPTPVLSLSCLWPCGIVEHPILKHRKVLGRHSCQRIHTCFPAPWKQPSDTGLSLCHRAADKNGEKGAQSTLGNESVAWGLLVDGVIKYWKVRYNSGTVNASLTHYAQLNTGKSVRFQGSGVLCLNLGPALRLLSDWDEPLLPALLTFLTE